jgi:hypothetical protein
MQTHPDVVYDIVTSRYNVARVKNPYRYAT